MNKAQMYRTAVGEAKAVECRLRDTMGDYNDPRHFAVGLSQWAVVQRQDPDWLLNAINKSQESKFAWNMLKVAAANWLRERPLPKLLADWLADVLEGKRSKPVHDPRDTLGRDMVVTSLVLAITRDMGLAATRNDGSPPYSGCDAVGEAMNLSYKTVERVWLRYRDSVSSLF